MAKIRPGLIVVQAAKSLIQGTQHLLDSERPSHGGASPNSCRSASARSQHTGPAEIEALWTPHAINRSLAWAGIASQVTRSDELERARLLAIEEIVERRSPAIEQQESMLLPKVPHVFELGDADGVIVLLTMRM